MNEGIQDENDDVFRNIYWEQREKIGNVLKQRPEVRFAVQILFARVNEMDHEE